MGRLFSRFEFQISQQVRLRFMAFVTIADTGIISYISTKNLAERWGFGDLSWLYPLCLDAVAAVGMDLWMSNSPAKRAAACLSLFAVGLSLAANVADWSYIGPGAAALGAVPPLMLAALLLTMHLHVARSEQSSLQLRPAGTGTTEASAPAPAPVPTTGTTGGRQRPQRGHVDAVTSPPTRKTKPATKPRTGTKGRKGPRPRVSDEEVLATVQGRQQPVTRRDLMDEFRMGTNRATRLLAKANNNGAQLDLTGVHGGDS